MLFNTPTACWPLFTHILRAHLEALKVYLFTLFTCAIDWAHLLFFSAILFMPRLVMCSSRIKRSSCRIRHGRITPIARRIIQIEFRQIVCVCLMRFLWVFPLHFQQKGAIIFLLMFINITNIKLTIIT